jgi:hypothetical protein
MGRARLGRNIHENPLVEFISIGGDLRFLERLRTHPALKVIERLDEEERRRVEVGEKLSAIEKTLDEAVESIGGLVWDFQQDGFLQDKGKKWLVNIRQAVQSISRTKLGISLERYRHGKAHRRGMLMSHPERYFYTAALVPYTAFLERGRGRKLVPNWDWIERWLRDVMEIKPERELCLRSWWHKEVLRRNSWPPRPLMYALSAGAAAYLDVPKDGMRAGWVIERDSYGRPFHMEDHPCRVKRTLSSADMAYLGGVFRYVPLVREDFKKLYKQTAALASGLPSNPMDALVHERLAETIERLPLKAQLRVAIDRGEVLSLKHITKRLKAEAGDKMSAAELRQLARLTHDNLQKAVAREARNAGAPVGKSRARS